MIFYRCDLCGHEQNMDVMRKQAGDVPHYQTVLQLPTRLKEEYPHIRHICHKCHDGFRKAEDKVYSRFEIAVRRLQKLVLRARGELRNEN